MNWGRHLLVKVHKWTEFELSNPKRAQNELASIPQRQLQALFYTAVISLFKVLISSQMTHIMWSFFRHFTSLAFAKLGQTCVNIGNWPCFIWIPHISSLGWDSPAVWFGAVWILEQIYFFFSMIYCNKHQSFMHKKTIDVEKLSTCKSAKIDVPRFPCVNIVNIKYSCFATPSKKELLLLISFTSLTLHSKPNISSYYICVRISV